MKAQILGIGHALPPNVLSNQDLEKMVDTSDEWIKERTGIRERRIASPHTCTSDLACEASRMAMQKAGVTPEDIDLIIVATATPDMFFPSTACIVQDKLKAGRAAAFDLAAGCTGFIYGLVTAEKFLMSGEYRYILLIGAEVLSRIVDYEDRNTCILFGDGAGAAVVGKGDAGYGMLSNLLGADGSGGKYLCLPAGGSAQPATIETIENRQHYVKMNGNEVFRFAAKVNAEVSERLLELAGLKYEDIDLFVPHQANIRIIKTAIRRMKIPAEKTLINVEQFGNTSAASIPVSLSMAEQEGRLERGDVVLLVGFGAGLTYGGALLRWGRD